MFTRSLGPGASPVRAAGCAWLLLFLPSAAGAPDEAEARPMSAIERLVEEAPEGSTVRVPPGRYEGHLVVRRPVALVAEHDVVLDGGEEGDVVRIEAPRVTLRGFVIVGTGSSLDRENAGVTVLAPEARILDNDLRDVLFGVYLKGAKRSVVRGNRIGGKDLPLARRGDAIRLWECSQSRVVENRVERSRDVVLWFSDGLYVARNVVRLGRYGLHFMYSDDNDLEENRLEHNSVGAFLMYSKRLTLRRNLFLWNRGPSGFGVGLKDMDGLVAEENVFSGNRIGLQIDNSPGALDVRHLYRRNAFAWNDIGVAFMPAVERNDFVDNTFFENVEQVAILGQGSLSDDRFTIDGRGNYWSDYRGFDLDRDGKGDLPYRAGGAFESLVDSEPLLRLFVFSPAQQAIDLASRAFPLFEAPPKVTDEAPRMTAHWPSAAAVAERGSGGVLLAVSLGLSAFGVVLLLAGRRLLLAGGVS